MKLTETEVRAPETNSEEEKEMLPFVAQCQPLVSTVKWKKL